MKKIRIAQIGINEYSHARDVFNTMKKMSEVFEIVGYVLVEDEREKFAHILSTYDGYKKLTLDEVLSDKTIQAVTVETEEKHLTKYAKLAVESGKHVHVEKPGGTDLLEFEDLIKTAKNQEKTLHFGYMYRYNPAVLDLLKKIKEGQLGEIVSIEANMDCYHPFAVRSWLNGYKGGMTFFLGCHLIDLILQIQGEPKSVLPLSKKTCLGGETGEDFGLAILEYERGYSVAKTCAVEFGGYMRRQLVVTGTKATVQLKPLEGLTSDGYYTDERFVGETKDWYADGNTTRSQLYARYDDMMCSFAKMVNGEKQNPYTLDYELTLYKIILRCCGYSL